MSVERDRIVADIMEMVRMDVQDLIYQGKDPEAVAKCLAHTMGSLRMLAHSLNDADPARRPHHISKQDQQEIEAVMESLPAEVRPLFDAGIMSGAHPLSYARRIQEMLVAALEEPEDDSPIMGLL